MTRWEDLDKDLPEYIKNKGLKNFRKDLDNTMRGFGISDLDPIDKLNKEKNLRLSDKLIVLTKDNIFFRKLYQRISFLYLGITIQQKLESKYLFAKYYGLENNAKPIWELSDSLFGNPKNVLKVNDNSYTMSLLRFYLLYAQTCKTIPWDKVNTMLEIGGGFGMFAEIIKKLYPHIEIILLDLPAQLQLQEEYLKNTISQKVSFIQPDEIKNVDFDLVFNSMSFEAMGKKTISNYLKVINEKAKFVCLHNKMTNYTMKDYLSDLSNFQLIYDGDSVGQFLETHHNLTCAIFKAS